MANKEEQNKIIKKSNSQSKPKSKTIDNSKNIDSKSKSKTLTSSKNNVKKVVDKKNNSNRALKKEVINKNNVKNIDMETFDEELKIKLNNAKQLPIKGDNIKVGKLHFSLFEVVLIVIITILSCILVGYFMVPNASDKNTTNENDIADSELQLFIEQYNYILDNYYGDIDKEQLMKDAISGMFSSLDDYSEIIDQESNTFSITLQGEYEGVGIVIANDSFGNIVIQDVYEQTPAFKAGLKAGDIITNFNDISLYNVSTTELVEMIAAANEMKITVLRNDESITVNLKRERIVLQSVNYDMFDNKIGYIDIDVFASNTKEQFEDALNDLEQQGMESLIIDLRDNTGGHLSAVEEMLYLFLDDTHIIYQLEDKNNVEKFFSKGKIDKKYQIVILQNGFSASASEIMASTLKEELNAYIIGNTSFGKGTVQTLKNVDQDMQYKFTTKRWLTPKGNWVNGVGVSPDVEVILSNEYYLNPVMENDNQLKTALDYLNN